MNTPVDITGVELTTPRLTLRPWRKSDLEDFFEYASVDGVGQMAGWLPHRDIQDSQKILDSFITKKKTFALDYQGKVIGSLGVEEYDEEQFPALLNIPAIENDAMRAVLFEPSQISFVWLPISSVWELKL